MYRPFLFIIVFLIPGIIIGSFIEIPIPFLIVTTICAVCAVIVKDNKYRAIFLGLAILCLGAFYYNFKTDRIAGTIANYVGSQRIIVGKIADVPLLEPDRTIYVIDVIRVFEGNGSENATGKVRVSVLRDMKNSHIYEYGDVVKFSGNLKLPQSKRNPGGMDYRAYLLQKGISCSMFTRQIEKIGTATINPFMKLAYSVREMLTVFFDKILPKDLSSLLTGITLGLKGNISGPMLQAFSDSGVIHVLAVSGLHVGLIYGFLYIIINRFGISGFWTFGIGSLAIFFYAIMAGSSPSVIRASIMVCTVMLGRTIGRNSDSLNNLCLAALILLILNPLNLFTVSFQLSFSAALGIILFYKIFKAKLSFLPESISSSIAVVISAQLLVWPFTAYYFHKVSLIGFLTNPIVVPMVGFVLILGLIGGFLGLFLPWIGAIFVKVSGLLLVIVQRLALFSSSLPGATIVIPIISPLFFILYFLLLLIFFYKPFENRIKNSYKIVMISIILFAMIVLILPKNSDLEITFIDVGQGDAALIKTGRGKTVLIDGGGIPSYYNNDFDVGSDIVQPVLYGKGITKIDVLIFSHFDDDHARGLLSILRNMKVDTVVYGKESTSDIYIEMINITRQKSIKTLQLGRGDKFTVDDISFEVLNPPKNKNMLDENDSSLVLRMGYKGFKFLFTGDLGIAAESELLESKLDLQANVLKVAHHGSSGSSSEKFLARVNPTFAIISVGKNNNYGHPSQDVINRLEQMKVRIYRTDIDGAVTFKINNNNVKIFTTINRER